jgi:hypothetical protein
MKRYLLILTVCTVALVLLGQTGCQPKQAGPVPDGGTAGTNGVKKGPRITLSKTVHDFGEVYPKATLSCDFRFTNTGDQVLTVEQPRSTCPCTVGKLTKTEYAPGESGVIRVTEFHVPADEGMAVEHLIVPTNDTTKDTIKLTVQAEVVIKVTFVPKKLNILLRNEGSERPEIKLTSIDGQPFAIKSFKATVTQMTCEYDPSVTAAKHVIRPEINIKGFHRRAEGRIEIELTHPECEKVTIPFVLVPIFQLEPYLIVLFDAEPVKPINKVLWLSNNLSEDYEVESVSPEKGLISVLSQEKTENVYKFELEIIPPPRVDADERRFQDTLYINIKGGKQLAVQCRGFYKKTEEPFTVE